MPCPRFSGECATFRRETKRRVRSCIDETLTRKSTHDAAHRDMRQTESFRESTNTGLDTFVEQFRDRLAVVLCGLGLVLLTKNAVMLGTRARRRRTRWF